MEQIAQLKDFQKIISDETVTTSKDITQPYSELEIIINQKSKNPSKALDDILSSSSLIGVHETKPEAAKKPFF